MNNFPLITVGIPFYNSGCYLEYSILSVLNQTYTNWELIIVNDGSTDNYKEILNKFNDSRIKIIDDGFNKGLPYRLNQISSMSSGDYYARMDADDIMTSDRLEKQVKWLMAHPEIDVVGSMAYSIDGNNKVIGLSQAHKYAPQTVEDVLNGNKFLHPTIMGKREWFLKHPYDTSLRRMQDLALWLTTVEESNFAYISEPLLFYRNIGIPSLSKYLSTQRYCRFFYKEKIGSKISFMRKIKLIMDTYLKSIIFLTFTCFHLESKLINKKSQLLSPEQIKVAYNSLDKSLHRNE